MIKYLVHKCFPPVPEGPASPTALYAIHANPGFYQRLHKAPYADAAIVFYLHCSVF